uniref:VPS9 domain-containing protein n=1 Tax=Cairina moschata TaxID=8855 RepID=A0A8C3BNI9_CAIMO
MRPPPGLRAAPGRAGARQHHRCAVPQAPSGPAPRPGEAAAHPAPLGCGARRALVHPRLHQHHPPAKSPFSLPGLYLRSIYRQRPQPSASPNRPSSPPSCRTRRLSATPRLLPHHSLLRATAGLQPLPQGQHTAGGGGPAPNLGRAPHAPGPAPHGSPPAPPCPPGHKGASGPRPHRPSPRAVQGTGPPTPPGTGTGTPRPPPPPPLPGPHLPPPPPRAVPKRRPPQPPGPPPGPTPRPVRASPLPPQPPGPPPPRAASGARPRPPGTARADRASSPPPPPRARRAPPGPPPTPGPPGAGAGSAPRRRGGPGGVRPGLGSPPPRAGTGRSGRHGRGGRRRRGRAGQGPAGRDEGGERGSGDGQRGEAGGGVRGVPEEHRPHLAGPAGRSADSWGLGARPRHAEDAEAGGAVPGEGQVPGGRAGQSQGESGPAGARRGARSRLQAPQGLLGRRGQAVAVPAAGDLPEAADRRGAGSPQGADAAGGGVAAEPEAEGCLRGAGGAAEPQPGRAENLADAVPAAADDGEPGDRQGTGGDPAAENGGAAAAVAGGGQQEVLQQRGPHPRGAGTESALRCHPRVRAGPRLATAVEGQAEEEPSRPVPGDGALLLPPQLPRAPHCPAPAQAAVRGVHPAVPGCQPEQPRGRPRGPRRPRLPLAGCGGAAACRAGGPAAPSLAQPALHVLGARARPGRAAAQPLQRAPRRRQPRRPRDGGGPPGPPGELLRRPGAVPGLTRGLALGGAPGRPRAGGVAAGAAEGRREGHPQRHRLLSLTLLAFEGLNTAAGKDQCLACIEEAFFPPLWAPLLALYRSVHRPREAALARSMERHRNASPAELGLPSRLFPAAPGLSPAYGAAVEDLRLIPLETCPRRKLDCIVRALRSICECAEEYCSARDSRAPASGTIGADDLLPLVSFTALRSGLPQLLPECAALEEFIHEGCLLGEEGYCLTSLRSALAYLETLP